jgi:hypothetical protein
MGPNNTQSLNVKSFLEINRIKFAITSRILAILIT